MTASQRRENILNYLKKADKPVSASLLASEFSVSRQIIVGDIAIMRAHGIQIDATVRGYVLVGDEAASNKMIIACRHGADLMEQELNICVDHGCKVLDVIVEHPIYGEIKGQLQLASRYDIKQFLEKIDKHKSHSLCELTNDIHLHTLECPDKETYERVCKELSDLGILIDRS